MTQAKPKDRNQRSAAHQRALAERRRVENAASTRKRRSIQTGAGVIAILAVGLALWFSLRPTGGTTGTAVAAILGAPTRDIPTSPVGNFHRVSGTPPMVGTKPAVVFVGAQYCPYCGAERWALVKALSRFGQFSGLRSSTNQAGEGGFGLIPTFDLTGAAYTSRYFAFDHKDTEDRAGNQLQSLNAHEQGWFNRYDSQGAIPLVVIGHYAMVGSGYSPSAIDGKSFNAVKSALQHGTTAFTRDINGESNVITALICRMDGARPSSVCTGATVRAVESHLH